MRTNPTCQSLLVHKELSRMKTIAQIYAQKLASLPVEENGKPSPSETKRLRLETRFQFWTTWLTILDPLDRLSQDFGGVSQIFRCTSGFRSEAEVVQGMKLMKQQLRLDRLTFSTYFKLV